MVIAHNIRSSHNIGALLRTADGLGIQKVYITGYSPYPKHEGDARLPHIAERLHNQIHKTALGAESSVQWTHADLNVVLDRLVAEGYELAILEQSSSSIPLNTFRAQGSVALVLGNEVDGVDQELLERIPTHLEIPMHGKKESFNVVAAASMALYHLRFL